MCSTFCRNTLVMLLLGSLHVIGPGFVSTEELSCTEMIPMMVIGARVVRGRDWEWGDQDGKPPTEGTVIRGLIDGWVRVQWANNHTNSYRMGDGNKCDLQIIQQNTEAAVSSSSSTTQSSSFSSSVTTPRLESSTSTTPLSPTYHQCTCLKEISESQAKTESETAELAKEAARLSVETAKVALEAAKANARADEAKRLLEVEAMKVGLEAARSTAKAEEAERLLALEARKVAIEAAKFISKAEEAKATAQVEAWQVYLEAAKSIAKAEESWATNAAEELIFERDRRNLTQQSLVTEKDEEN